MKSSYRVAAEKEKHLIPEEFWVMLEKQANEISEYTRQNKDMIFMDLVDDFVRTSIEYAARTGKTLI